jgi:predicted Abi (CAAX) family protease
VLVVVVVVLVVVVVVVVVVVIVVVVVAAPKVVVVVVEICQYKIRIQSNEKVTNFTPLDTYNTFAPGTQETLHNSRGAAVTRYVVVTTYSREARSPLSSKISFRGFFVIFYVL